MTWGLFDIHACTSFFNGPQNKLSKTKIGLVGSAVDSIAKSALYLQNNNSPLVVGGATDIVGDIYCSSKGVKNSKTNKLSTTNHSIDFKQNRLSNSELPNLLDQESVKRIQSTFTKRNNNYSPSNENSFLNETIVYRDSVLYLTDEYYGNIMFAADSLIYISNKSSLENIIVAAPEVYIEQGFEGSIQVFATKNIKVDQNVYLQYPSALTMLTNSDIYKHPELVVDNNTTIEGFILIQETTSNDKHHNKLRINRDAIVQGEIFADAVVELRGDVYGHISCNQFSSTSGSTSFSNHLYNVIIDVEARPKHHVSFAKNKDSKKKIITWLN